ncbi:MAG TPA: hypothetical protein VFE24_04625 [Pirellulales bacterium]|jgi:hypothetical protein|nr:hypothetical protein [Pirellulales bacterium]
MSCDLEEPIQQEDAPDERYRAVCASSVVAAGMGLISPLAWFDPLFLLIPLAGIAFAVRAIRKIRREPDRYLGAAPANLGLMLSLGCFLSGAGWQCYVYRTELPEGYRRLYFDELQPDPSIVGQVLPPNATKLDGDNVLIKGYMYPGSATSGINEFILVRDRGECCFGGNPKLTDRIQVRIDDPNGVDYRFAVKVAGKLHVDPSRSHGMFYYLEGAQVR